MDKDKILVWKDDKGEYKLGYSQYLQRQTLKTNQFLLIAVVVLVLMLAVGAWYAQSLVQRIDDLNVLGRLTAQAVQVGFLF
jgi:phage gp46-like protein